MPVMMGRSELSSPTCSDVFKTQSMDMVMSTHYHHHRHHPADQQEPQRGHVKSPLTDCSGCGNAILDRYYLLAVDRPWHSQCLKCSQCQVSLDEERSCFSRDGQIFCKEDYYKLFAVKRCTRCGQGIYANDLVMRARDNIYHMACFTCAWCTATLSQGDYFGISNNLVYCRVHFEMRTANAATLLTDHLNRTCPQSLPPLVTPLQHFDYFMSSSEQASHPGDLGQAMSLFGHHRLGPHSHFGGPGMGTNGPTAPTGPARKGRPRKRKSPLVTARTVTGGECGASGVLESGGAQSVVTATQLNGTQQSQGMMGQLSAGCPLTSDQSDQSGVEASTPGQSQANMNTNNGSMNTSSCHVSGRTKRMRTSFKHHQLRTMKQYFAINQNPDAKDLKQLAQKTSLSKRVLQVWFQNARAKWRRNNIKMGGDGQCGQSLHELGGGQSSQASLLSGHDTHSLLNAASPSTGIGSPDGSSTRHFDSSPNPSLTSTAGGGGGHGGGGNDSRVAGSTDGSSLDQFPGSSSSGIRPLMGSALSGVGTSDQTIPANLAFQELF